MSGRTGRVAVTRNARNRRVAAAAVVHTCRLGAAIAVLLAGGGATTQAPAQQAEEDDGPEWFPASGAVAPLRAAPGEVQLGAGLIFADRELEGDFEDTNLEAQIAIGYALPVVRLSREGPGRAEVVLEFEVGTFSRFAMETGQKDLINSDWRVGAPLGIRAGAWEMRFELLHVSSHLGDDFLTRFPSTEAVQVTRNGFEALLARRLGPSVRLYAGGDWNPDHSRTVEEWAGRFGVEWDAGWTPRSGPVAPYVAWNFEITELTERLAGTGVAGLGLDVGRLRFLLDLQWHFGPSPMGQFRTVDEDYVGLNLRGML